MTLRPGQSYTFEAQGIGLTDTTLTLRNSAGAQVAFDDDSGAGLNSLINFTAPGNLPSGGSTYFLDVRGFGSRTGSYRVLAHTPGDQAANTGTSASIATDLTRTGFVGVSGDHDWFRTTLSAGTTYVFTQNGSGTNSLGDPVLRLRNSVGTQVAVDDDSGPGLNSRLTFTAGATGTYFLDAGAFADSGTGNYALGMTEVDDIFGTTGTNRNISISGVPNGAGFGSGRINSAADQDFHRVFLRAGELYQFQANNAGGATGLNDPTLALRNSAGAQVAFDDDGGVGLNSQIQFRPTASGNYYLDVGGFGSNVGNYSVVAREVQGNTGTYSTLGVSAVIGGSTSLTGDLHANGDQDFHRMTLTGGRTYRFDLRGSASGGGSLADPFLELRNSGGAIVRSDDDSGTGFDSSLTFQVAGAGAQTFFANTRAFGNNGSGTYRLQATTIA
ncbi:hypothetical protein N825_14350 [Skermanella stibiiresistens SB22]|uniref:Peptidase C-terminal archaeal/bacterial domain-containing protein n=1 Tax=Skermanella stibiiresistens SB22 TaxID=1385369 RepID=W9GWP6_9PROT|nr:pre-peptidase C-terminal domain-containing protein [Skermanella stibiiresistens]EWY38209.1 hypothetical protein N825_14350 [Skermanella stibiiresistens SB22]